MTQQEIVNELLDRFLAVWSTIGTGDYPVAWPDKPLLAEEKAMIDGVDADGESVEITPWARITIRTNLRKQKTLGGVGFRRYTTQGILFVEVFTPTGDGNVTSYSIAETIRDEFERPNVASNSVWTRESRLTENGVEGLWSRTTITTEWEAEQVK